MKSLILALGIVAALSSGTVGPSFGRPAFGRPSFAPSFAPHSGTAAAPAGIPRARSAILDKTRFVVDVGTAFYAFHHFVYARYTNGSFQAGASHRVSNIAKAAIAVLFSYHQLKAAYKIANSSNSPTLRLLAAPLNGLVGQTNAAYAQLHGGVFQVGSVTRLNSSLASFSNTAARDKIAIKDIGVVVPGAA